MYGGTDVTSGAVSRKLLGWLTTQAGCAAATLNRVVGLRKINDGWLVRARDLATGATRISRAKFVFIGAGGGTLPLLQKSRLREARGLGGFPIGGQWLVCDNLEVVARHQAKVYGQPQAEAPTMAVPHLDTRILDGKKTLLFGPFAAWTTKFLHKAGRHTDLPFSMRLDNVLTLATVGLHNLGLIRYLVQQGTQSMNDRLRVLRGFYPGARSEDWKLVDAGIRVQAIKETDGKAGIVHYGTEVMTSADRSLSALLGASPGASVSVSIVLEVIKNCFPHLLSSDEGRARMTAMIPSYDEELKLPQNANRYEQLRQKAAETLQLQ